jgi:hypothetical protein
MIPVSLSLCYPILYLCDANPFSKDVRCIAMHYNILRLFIEDKVVVQAL